MRSIFALPFLLLASCTTNTNQDTANGNMPTIPEIENSRQPLPANQEGLSAALQGEWNRVSYPFGTITFTGDKVKTEDGEGARNPAAFESFRLTDSCAYSVVQSQNAQSLDFLVLDGKKECHALRLAGDTLYLDYDPMGGGIKYTRSRPLSPADKRATTLPGTIQGTWAMGTGNCGARNQNQIVIDARSVQFFEGRAALTQITEYEATRIAGKFEYKMADGKTRPYQFTLDAQDAGKVLIMRQYGEGAPAGILKYERCD